MKIISKQEARARRLKYYATGKPCKWGHTCKRYVSSGACFECAIIYAAKWGSENSEKAAKSRRIYREKNKHKAAEYSRMWAEKNPEKTRENVRRWQKKNPDRSRVYCRNRRARKRNAEGSHNGEDIRRLEQLQKMKCATCLVSMRKGYHVDHIVPLSKGGSNNFYNLQLLCPTCNMRKHAKGPIDWAQENGRLL